PLSKAGYCPTPPLSVFYNSLTLSLCLCFYLYYRCFCFFSIPDGNLPREVFCQARKGIGSHSLCYDCRISRISAFPDALYNRNFSQKGNLIFFRELSPALFAKQIILIIRQFVRRKISHIFHNT